MNILYAALQRLPVAVVVLVITVGAGWHLLPILAGVGLLVGASERFIVHRRLHELDDEIADLTAADEFRRDLRNTRAVLDGGGQEPPVQALLLPLESVEPCPQWRDRAHNLLGRVIRRLFAAAQSWAAWLWHHTPEAFLIPFALAVALWDGRRTPRHVDAPLTAADELGYHGAHRSSRHESTSQLARGSESYRAAQAHLASLVVPARTVPEAELPTVAPRAGVGRYAHLRTDELDATAERLSMLAQRRVRPHSPRGTPEHDDEWADQMAEAR